MKRHIAKLKATIASEEQARSAPPVEPQPAHVPEPSPAPAARAAVPPAAMPVAAVEETRAPPRPLVKRPWFWVGVAGGAVVIGAVVALAVVFSAKDPSPSMGSVNGN